MRLSATHLKQNLFQVLDAVLNNKQPIEVERNGRILKIMPAQPFSKLDNLEAHDTIVGNPESIIHIPWSQEWQEQQHL